MQSQVHCSAQTLILATPDDWHLHLRDDPYIASVLPDTLRCFRRAIVMPNLHPPVTTVTAASGYRARILKHVPHGIDFAPLMTLYLSDSFDVTEIAKAAHSGFVHGIKLYPKGIARQGQPGVSDITRCFPVLEAMQKHDLPLLGHGESIDPEVDTLDRRGGFSQQARDR